MSTPANRLTAELLIAIPEAFPDTIRLWRSNTGGAVPMAVVRVACAMIRTGKIEAGIQMLQRPMKFGVLGGADLSGIMRRDVRLPYHSQRSINGVRLEIEVKAGADKQRPDQEAFQSMIESLGGVYIVARDVEGCLEELRRRA
jgi:hypothetical protein